LTHEDTATEGRDSLTHEDTATEGRDSLTHEDTATEGRDYWGSNRRRRLPRWTPWTLGVIDCGPS
jgi:hypothetical protein